MTQTAAPDTAQAPRAQGAWKSLAIALGVIASVLAIGGAIVIGTSGVSLGDVAEAVWISIVGGTLTGDMIDKYPVITELRMPRVLLADRKSVV